MSDSLANLILSLTPEDGTSVGNGAILALLQEQMPSVTDDDYVAARDTLIDDGVLGLDQGCGEAIFQIIEEVEDDQDTHQDDDGFELALTEEPAQRQRRPAARRAAMRHADGPVQVLSYRHGETRVNNPEVGMVHASSDPDGEKTTWTYDPHLDPALSFDSARAGIENPIDNALASDDPERMRDALQELKRLCAVSIR